MTRQPNGACTRCPSRLDVLLKGSGVAVVSAAAYFGELDGALAQFGFGSGAVDVGAGDIGLVNYAYALEQLESAFYTQVVASPIAA